MAAHFDLLSMDSRRFAHSCFYSRSYVASGPVDQLSTNFNFENANLTNCSMLMLITVAVTIIID